MVQDALDRYRNVMWIDAGSTVTAPLRTTIFPIFRANKFITYQARRGGQHVMDRGTAPMCPSATVTHSCKLCAAQLT